jgi:hypothetical protein
LTGPARRHSEKAWACAASPALKMHPVEVVRNHASTVRGASPASGLSGAVVWVPPSAVEIPQAKLRVPGAASVASPAGSVLPFPDSRRTRLTLARRRIASRRLGDRR